MISAELVAARADLIAAALFWHRSDGAGEAELHEAADRYARLSDAWLDSMAPAPTVEPP